MELNKLQPAEGSKQARRRVGRGIGSGLAGEIPDSLLQRLEIPRDKAEEAVSKVLEAEAALRELASQFHPAH
mgnify:CR=1 FL=1